MQELEKILAEIDETIERYGENPYIDEKVTDLCYGMNIAKDIIRKHMNGGWIPVEKCLPEDGENALWCSDDGRMMIGVFHKDYYLEFGIAVAENYNQIMHDCAAWMPLPEKYDPKRRKQKHDC